MYKRQDLILPAPAYTEKEGIYVNTEGRVQYATPAVSPKGDAKEEWALFRAVSAMIGKKLPFDNISQLRGKLKEEYPSFAVNDGEISQNSKFDLRFVGEGGNPTSEIFTPQIDDYYLTNAIARASLIMAKCSALKAQSTTKVAAEKIDARLSSRFRCFLGNACVYWFILALFSCRFAYCCFHLGF